MITFKKIRWKNFLSTGNQWTEVNFDEVENTIIVGTNGSGKSTILDALTFSLFNKPFRRINKPQLVNSVNDRDCCVEIEFDIKGKEYKIIRGLKPNKFEIWIDGKVQDQDASALEQQKRLEHTILKLNFKSFTQVVILGSSTFVPFMQLTLAHRREIIEDLLDIKIFSSMNSIIKDKIRGFREDIRTIELRKDSVKDKIKMQEEFIRQIEQSGKDDIKEKQKIIKNLAKEANDHILRSTDLQEDLHVVEKDVKIYSDSSKKLRKLSGLRAKIQTKSQTLGSECDFFEENVSCPTCTQNI